MRKFLLATIAIAALGAAAGTAPAADMPPRQPYPERAPVKAPALPLFNWSGFYVGVQGGYGWGNSEFDFPAGSTGGFDVNGWHAGGTIGANYQVGQTVLGVEADIAWTNMDGSTACGGSTCETSAKWLGTARGRLGYAFDRFMPYLTAGAAFGRVQANVPGVGSASDTRIGWTAGAGLEYAITNNWSIKTEYLYVDLGKFDCGVACGGGGSTDVKFDSHIVRTGLNVRF